MNTLTALDIFRFTPKEFLLHTKTGALLTLSFFAILFIFLKQELPSVLHKPELKSEIIFENLYIQSVPIYIDVDILNLPCEIADLKFASKRGVKVKLSRYKLIKGPEGGIITIDEFKEDRGFEGTKKAYMEKEGCKIKGFFNLHLTVNTFYLGFGNADYVTRIYTENERKTGFNLAHKINKLHFSKEKNFEFYEKFYRAKGLRTLDGHTVKERKSVGEKNFGMNHNYFINLTPNSFDRSFSMKRLFQFTASHYQHIGMKSGIFFT